MFYRDGLFLWSHRFLYTGAWSVRTACTKNRGASIVSCCTSALLIPRQCRETCDVGGYEVPKGSRVIVNAWAIARSPAHWDNADKFMPERFEHNGAPADYYKAAATTTQFEYLPFGHGRRICPGMGFGLSTLEMLVARLLYYFDWSLPDGMKVEDLDMDMTVGASARRTNKLHLVASPYQVPM